MFSQVCKDKGNQIAMQVDAEKASARGDVLGHHVSKQAAFAGPGFPDDCNVF